MKNRLALDLTILIDKLKKESPWAEHTIAAAIEALENLTSCDYRKKDDIGG